MARNDVVIGKQYPTGESSRFTLNRQGEYQSETQPNGTEHQYDRNKLGQIIHDRVTALGADIDDSVLRISTTFNNRGLEETITTCDNATVGSGTIVNQVKKEYDAFNQMISDAQEHGGAVDANSPEVTYTFSDGSNSALRKLTVSTPSGHKVNYDYGADNSIADAFNRPASLKIDGETGNLVEYEFTGLVLNSKIKYPTPDTELNTSYDRFARIIDMPWTNAAGTTTHAHIQYGYDAASRRTWRKDLTPHADDQHDRAYTYDALSQVKSAEVGALNLNESGISGVPEQSETWTYDETGNWLAYEKDEDGTTSIDQSRRHNESNQITVIDGTGTDISHDLNGNTTLLPTGDDLQGAPSKLKWNPWNMLVEARDSSDDSLINAYQYDGRFRRTTVTESDGTVTHAYYNDQWRQVEELDGTSTDPVKVHYWGALNRWELARRDRDSNGNGTLDESLYCIKDAMDPIAVIDSSGTIQERFEYTAFGVVSFLGAHFAARSNSGFDWDFLFHGEFRDLETRLYNYGFRYFDPRTGRWPSRDPIGETFFMGGELDAVRSRGSVKIFDDPHASENIFYTKGSTGTFNLYQFVGNDSINRFDLFGLMARQNPKCYLYRSKCVKLSKAYRHPNPIIQLFAQTSGHTAWKRDCLLAKCTCRCKCPTDTCRCKNRLCPDHPTTMKPFYQKGAIGKDADCRGQCPKLNKSWECPTTEELLYGGFNRGLIPTGTPSPFGLL